MDDRARSDRSGARRSLLPRQRAALAVAVALTLAAVGVAAAAPEFPPGGNPSVTLDVTPGDGDNLPSPATITVIGAGFGSNLSGDIVQCTFDAATQFDICSSPLARFTSDTSGNFSQPVQVTSTFTGTNAANQMVQVDCLQVACTVQAVSDNGQFVSQHHITFAGATTSTSTTLSTSTSTTSTSTSTSSTSSTSTSTSTTSTTVAPSTTTTSSTAPPSSTSTSVPSPSTTTTVPASECSRLEAARAQFNAGIDQAVIAAAALPADERDALLAQLGAVRAQGNAQFDQALDAADCNAVPSTSTTSTTVTPSPTTSSTSSTTLPDDDDDDDDDDGDGTDEERCAQLQQARALLNSRIDQLVAAVGTTTPERAGRLAQLAAARSLGNAQFDRILAASGCVGG
jgi:hypothetical protein